MESPSNPGQFSTGCCQHIRPFAARKAKHNGGCPTSNRCCMCIVGYGLAVLVEPGFGSSYPLRGRRSVVASANGVFVPERQYARVVAVAIPIRRTAGGLIRRQGSRPTAQALLVDRLARPEAQQPFLYPRTSLGTGGPPPRRRRPRPA